MQSYADLIQSAEDQTYLKIIRGLSPHIPNSEFAGLNAYKSMAIVKLYSLGLRREHIVENTTLFKDSFVDGDNLAALMKQHPTMKPAEAVSTLEKLKREQQNKPAQPQDKKQDAEQTKKQQGQVQDPAAKAKPSELKKAR